MNYLKNLTYRHMPSQSVQRRKLTFLHFHHWCKRVCWDSGHYERYLDLWRQSSSEWVLKTGMAELVYDLYDEQGNHMPKYDAILVDEGQDYHPLWWQTLKKACNPGGEMVLVADMTQDIYGTAKAWTEEAMNGAGFRGNWAQLKISYRLPPPYIPHVRRFADRFLTSNKEVDIPTVQQSGGQTKIEFYPVEPRWVQVKSEENLAGTCVSEARKMMESLPSDTAIADISVLTSISVGIKVVDILNQENNIRTVHTFWPQYPGQEQNQYRRTDLKTRPPWWKEAASRKKKLIFGLLMLKSFNKVIRVTTLHSFKGWESRLLIVVIDRATGDEQLALIYTALTRLQRHVSGSKITVICAANELLAYGREWPGLTTK